jgi:hypothetical protein
MPLKRMADGLAFRPGLLPAGKKPGAKALLLRARFQGHESPSPSEITKNGNGNLFLMGRA